MARRLRNLSGPARFLLGKSPLPSGRWGEQSYQVKGILVVRILMRLRVLRDVHQSVSEGCFSQLFDGNSGLGGDCFVHTLNWWMGLGHLDHTPAMKYL